MAVNPDPRPGRWVLPLVVLGMVVFAYVFVRSLPGADADSGDLAAGDTTTTTVAQGTDGDDTADTTTTTTTPLDPEVVAYLNTLEEMEGRLIEFQTEMATVNGQWDAEPREIEFSEAEEAFITLAEQVEIWAEEVAEMTPPEGLTTTHETVVSIANNAADEADAVLEGLRAPDTGELRQAAVQRFDETVRAFTAAVDEAEQVAQTLGSTGGDDA